MPADDAPAFRSLALDAIPRPDHVDVIAVALPPGSTTDPSEWTRMIFSVGSTPIWVRILFGLRQLLVPLIGVRPGDPDTAFAVRRVVGEEALVEASDRHLDFAAGIGVDTERRLVRSMSARCARSSPPCKRRSTPWKKRSPQCARRRRSKAARTVDQAQCATDGLDRNPVTRCPSRVKPGHCGDVCYTTALPPKADVRPRSCYVAEVPITDIASKSTRRRAFVLVRQEHCAECYLNNSGRGSGMKPSRLGICTRGSVWASSTTALSMTLPSARM